MGVLYKQGVMGRLSRTCRKCLGRIHDQCFAPLDLDMVITSVQEGTHGAGSLHHMDPGEAFDFRRLNIALKKIKAAAGPGFDVVKSHAGACHVEHDPKI